MKTEFKIEKGIPIPEKHKGYTAAIRSLKKDESVFLPTQINSAYSIINQMGMSGHYTVRTVEGGARVWRIK